MSGDATVDVTELARQMLENQGSTDNSDESQQNSDESDTSSVDDSGTEDSSGTPKGHPAWQDILAAVPEEYHEALTPKLKDWDSGVTKRFQEIHSQYDPLKAYQPLADQEIDPEALSSAWGLYQAVSQNPEDVFRALGEAYGLLPDEQESDDDGDSFSDIPKAVQDQLDRQERAIEFLVEQAQAGTNQNQQEAQQRELENYLEGLTEQYGEFDEDYVLTKMASGIDGEVAVRTYQEIVGTPTPAPTPKTPAPSVLNGNGGRGAMPDEKPLDLGSMDKKDVRSLVAQALQASAQTNS